ncbi:MAG: dienelactone hydrolase family protein [Planctomycetota bacterium]
MLSWRWIALIPTLALLAPQESQPTAPQRHAIATGFLHKTLSLGEAEYDYCVYVPPEYTPDKPWPVILFLHGSGECGRDGFLQTDVGIARAIRRYRYFFPAIVVMPQCRPGTSWSGPMAHMALASVEATSREYYLDADRLYLTGLSLGGQGTWLLGAQYADQFAALVPICGFVELGESTGQAEKLVPHLANMPIWCFHGDTDRSVPVVKAREMVKLLKAAGGQVKYTEYEGVSHNSWDRAYKTPELWQWLFTQRRSDRNKDGGG